MTKGMVYRTKECNYNSTVIVHQQGGYDITCKIRILINRFVLLNKNTNTKIITVELVRQSNFKGSR